MNKLLIEKLSIPGEKFATTDMTPDEKKALMAFLELKGMPNSTFYLRFFQKGFDKWEMLGIKNCKSQFLKLPDVAQTLLEAQTTSDELPGNKGYLYTLAQDETPGVFYRALKVAKVHINDTFVPYMQELGMSSNATISKRFNVEDWKAWEYQGIKSALEEFVESNCE